MKTGDVELPGGLPAEETARRDVAQWLQADRTRIVWSIAGFDPSSGAGVTADLQVFAAHGFWGCSAVTALTVQSTLGVFGTEAVQPELLEASLERLWDDLPPAGIKIGMLGRPELMRVVARFLGERLPRSAQQTPVVLDPVLRSSSGHDLYPAEGLAALDAELLPHVGWITPNWAELAILCGEPVRSLADAEAAARVLAVRHPHLRVVGTGGDQETTTDLLLSPGDGHVVHFPGARVETRSTHGTGCAFSSALLCRLLAGSSAAEAVREAKAYVEEALRRAPGVGHGRGPLELLWPMLGDSGARRAGALLP